MTRHLFLVGTGRCGSTLINEILCGHADVRYISVLEDRLGMTRESFHNAVARAYRVGVPYVAVSTEARGPKTFRQHIGRRTVARCGPSEAYRVIRKEISPAFAQPFRDLTSSDCGPWLEKRLRRFFTTEEAPKLFVHKFTGWPRIGALAAAFPDARFIHVVRDGRAVANSLIQMPWWDGWRGPTGWSFGPLSAELSQAWENSGHRFPVLAGIEWKLLVDGFEVARAEIDATRILEVRYEDFVSHPTAHLETILAFAGLDKSTQFERFSESFAVRPGRMAEWVKELRSDDLTALDQVLAGTLARYGYPESYSDS
jgi:hypothetical protein